MSITTLHLTTPSPDGPVALCDGFTTAGLVPREAFNQLSHSSQACLACLRTLERDAVQAQLDALMLEFCPEDMTLDQRKTWAAHQRPAPEGALHG